MKKWWKYNCEWIYGMLAVFGPIAIAVYLLVFFNYMQPWDIDDFKDAKVEWIDAGSGIKGHRIDL